jgi:ribosomal-protein-alanine N-acetyltransferase
MSDASLRQFVPGARLSAGDSVTLRTMEPEDAGFEQRACTNPEIRYPLGTTVRTVAEIEEELTESDEDDHFLICTEDDAGPGAADADDLRRIGGVGVHDVDWRRPELGYWLVPEVHREGYGTEAISLAVAYTFRTYDHPAIGAGVYEFNDASRGLLESLGFEEEGRTRRDRFIDGEYVDTVQYVLLREDWWERNPAHSPSNTS